MNDLNIKDLLSYIKTKIIIPIITTLVVIICGSIYSLFIKIPTYTSTASIILSSDGITKVTKEDIEISKSLSETFKDISLSQHVLSKTIQDLNLNESLESLKQQIKITTSADTVITKISFSSNDATKSQNVANSIAINLIEQIKKTYTISNIEVFEKATKPTVPNNINIIKDESTHFIIGIALGLFIITVKLIIAGAESELKKVKNNKIKITFS